MFEILEGDLNPSSPRTLTPQAINALQLVNQAIQAQGVSFIQYDKPLSYVVCATSHSPIGVFWQTGPLLWVHLPASPPRVLMPYPSLVAKLIIMGLSQSKQFFGKEPNRLILPYSKEQINWLLQMTDNWPLACLSFPGTVDSHYPGDKLLQFARIHPFTFQKVTANAHLPSIHRWVNNGNSCCGSKQQNYGHSHTLYLHTAC